MFSIKYLSLAILTVQNAAISLMLRYSRTVSGDLYISSTVVAITEVRCVLWSAK
jgi:UDP-sugar transporter A1/2/3